MVALGISSALGWAVVGYVPYAALWGLPEHQGAVYMPKPPEYGEGIAKEHCSNCRFYEPVSRRGGTCRKYAVPVIWDKWCSSWASQNVGRAARDLWKEHRQKLKEAS